MMEFSECLQTGFGWLETWMWTEDDVVLVGGIDGENGNGCLVGGHAWKDFLIFCDGLVGGASCRCKAE